MDVFKLQQKNKLAKELVEQGIADNIEAAHKQIENEGLINTKDDFMVIEQAKPITEERPEPQTRPDDENKILRRKIAYLEGQLGQLRDLFTKYQQQTDKNLQELSAMKASTPKLGSQQPVENKKEEKEENPRVQENISPDIYDINKVFDNSHNRMMKK